MSIDEYVRVFKRSWLVILACSLAGLLIAGLAAFLSPKSYVSQGQVFVTGTSTKGISDAYTSNLVIRQQVQSYVGIVNSSQVIDQVKAAQRIDTPTEELVQQVAANNPPGTSLIDMTAAAATPAAAQELLQGVMAEFVVVLSTQDSATAGTRPLIKVNVTQAPTLPTAPSGVATRLLLALGLLLGLIVGILASLLRNSVDTTVQTVEQAEGTGPPVIGRIPRKPDRGESIQRLAVIIDRQLHQGPRRAMLTAPRANPEVAPLGRAVAAALVRQGVPTVLLDEASAGPAAAPAASAAGGRVSVAPDAGGGVTGALDRDGVLVVRRSSQPGAGAFTATAAAELFDALAKRAGTTIVTAPAALDSAASETLATQVQAVYLIVERNRTPMAQIREAVTGFTALGVPVTGLIMRG